MILLDSKTKTSTSSSALDLAPQEEPKSNGLSFSELLHGVTLKKEEKVVQNGVVVLALDGQSVQIPEKEIVVTDVKNSHDENVSKADGLLSLLQGDAKSETVKVKNKREVTELLELNPDISKNIKPSELKVLIYNAKKYLKDKIIESADFKKSEIEALPKTLKGLAQVAKKFGIDVSKITLEDVRPKLKGEEKVVKANAKSEISNVFTKLKEDKPKVQVERVISKVALKIENEVKKSTTAIIEPKVELKPHMKATVDAKTPTTAPEIKHEAKQEVKQELKVEPKVELKPHMKVTVDAKTPTTAPEIKYEAKHEAKQELKQEHKIEPKVELKPQMKATVDAKTPTIAPEIKHEVKQEAKQELKQEHKVEPKVELKPQMKESVDAKTPQVILAKETPFFKTQTLTKEITTQELIGTKITAKELKPSKVQKKDEILKLLLQGKKAIKQESSLTADFSVATARVIAPEAPTKSHTTLESLLHNDTNEHSTASKIDGFAMPKAESLDLKMYEAKQMTKYISQDVKTAINDYKSPFTRIKVELHPQRLGSVELTVVQRGKNLHINLSSNNAAINTLALNSNDLKLQLSNNGINNASLNFNNNSQGSDSGFSGQQQQNSQNGRDAQREYGYFEKEEVNEEISHSLEIIVPSYA